MGVKRSFKQILLRMANQRMGISGLSLLMAGIMVLQMAVMPVGAAARFDGSDQESQPAVSEPAAQTSPTAPKLKNTFALVAATGGQSGDAVQYFKVIYEDTDGVRRSEYILRQDTSGSFEMAQKYANGQQRRRDADTYFSSVYDNGNNGNVIVPIAYKPLKPESRSTYLFEPMYAVKRILGIEIMHNAGQWDCQGLWIYEVDEIFGEEMYGYVGDDGYISFAGWRVAELEMKYQKNERIYTTLQNSRPKLYRMGENGHPEFNLLTYERSEAKYDSTANGREYAMRLDITDVYGAGVEKLENKGLFWTDFRDPLKMEIRYQDTFGCVQTVTTSVFSSGMIWAKDMGVPVATIKREGTLAG